MMWLGAFYLVVFVICGLIGCFLSYREKEHPAIIICDVLAGLSIAFLAASYWHSSGRIFIGTAAPYIFVVALGWEIIIAKRQINVLRAAPELSESQKRFAPFLAYLFGFPAYLLAGIAAFVEKH